MCSRPCPEARPAGGGLNLPAREGLRFWGRAAFRSRSHLQIPAGKRGAGVWGGPFGGTVCCGEGVSASSGQGPGMALGSSSHQLLPLGYDQKACLDVLGNLLSKPAHCRLSDWEGEVGCRAGGVSQFTPHC